jgi:two-component system sensor histidine kinase UhpB
LLLALATWDWDVITSAYQLAHFTTTAALEIVQESGLDIPFIVVSGVIGEETAVRLMKSGAHDYVMKDNLVRLVPAIEREMKEAVIRRRRREADQALRETEARLSVALGASGMGVWEWDLTTQAVWWSAECFAIAGQKEFDGTVDAFLRLVDLLDMPRVQAAVDTAVSQSGVLAVEFRVRTTGGIRWLSNIGRVQYDARGKPLRLIGTVQDITARKEAEETLKRTNRELEELAANHRSVLGQLHSISEEERAHLAREIHDQLGQSLTILKMSAYAMEQSLRRGDTGGALQRCHASASSIDGLIQSVRDIATELRPPLLDRSGLAAALEWQVELLRKQHELEIELELPSVEPSLTDVQKISAFRIAQESLTNIIRHSGSKSANVSLREEADSVRLTVRDMGGGFQSGEGLSGSLGIFGMRERAQLIGAILTIESYTGQGTKVELIIPKVPASRIS